MMKTKREVLKHFAMHGNCKSISCDDCPYSNTRCGFSTVLLERLAKIGAMALLRQSHRKREFDVRKVLTCVAADQAKIGMRGYFADNIKSLRRRFENDEAYELLKVNGEDSLYCFNCGRQDYALFYPIDEEVN